MSPQHDESLVGRIKRMLGMGGDDGHDHAGADHTGHDHAAESGGHPGDAAHHPTAPDAGVSDAARGASPDANEDPAMRRDEFMETGAASGQVAMPGGEEPVVGDEDREKADRAM